MKKIKKLILNLILLEPYNYLYNKVRFWYFNTPLPKHYCFRGRIGLVNNGLFSIGAHCKINSGAFYNTIGGDSKCNFTIDKSAEIIIGSGFGISNSTIFSSYSIQIGNNVLIGGSCKIYDTDFHAINIHERLLGIKQNGLDKNAKKRPIVIHDGVWIGGHCIVLKGSEIGENSIIGAGSVVSGHIPANEIWAGNPAKFIRKIK